MSSEKTKGFKTDEKDNHSTTSMLPPTPVSWNHRHTNIYPNIHSQKI